MKWTRPERWQVHAYHPESWGNWGFDVDASTTTYATDNGAAAGDGVGAGATLRFRSGGNQEARGGNGMGTRYFSGILEELDGANEFYYDGEGGKLYWAPPHGVSPSPSDGLVLPVLPRLIVVSGTSPSDPAVDINVSAHLVHPSAAFQIHFGGFGSRLD
jgi:hypothetical protein